MTPNQQVLQRALLQLESAIRHLLDNTSALRPSIDCEHEAAAGVTTALAQIDYARNRDKRRGKRAPGQVEKRWPTCPKCSERIRADRPHACVFDFASAPTPPSAP